MRTGCLLLRPVSLFLARTVIKDCVALLIFTSCIIARDSEHSAFHEPGPNLPTVPFYIHHVLATSFLPHLETVERMSILNHSKMLLIVQELLRIRE